MSLYNILFGKNQYADLLLATLGLKQSDCGRFRDCYPSEDGTKIIVHTRNGGGNREEYQSVIDELADHPCYVSDNDDDFDCTYADIIFRVPDGAEAFVKSVADATDTTPPAERWKKLLADMQSGKDSAVVSRAMDVGKQIFSAIDAAAPTAEVKTPEGSVIISSIESKP